MALTRKPTLDTKAAAVAALEARAHPVEELAKRANVSPRTLYSWQQQAQQDPALQAKTEKQRAALAEKMETLANKLADKLTSIADEATWENKGATAMGISIDKWLALTGQPSQITEHRHLHLHLAQDALAALAAYLEAGYTAQEARQCLQQDDPDLFRALPAIEAEWEPVEDGEESEPEQIEGDSAPIPESASID